MSGKTYNPFISFYSKYNISPVRQDISDFRAHLLRREKLFRRLGLPPLIFSDRDILEIGPGGGYNSLAFFAWGANVDFIEPNPKAQKELPELLGEYDIENEKWHLFECIIEDFMSEKKYDVILAEGFIPSLYSREKVIAGISDLVKPGGVVVVTCVDSISIFFEFLKRLIGWHLLQKKNVVDFDQKVKILSRAFGSHLESLENSSRLLEDWVKDIFFTPYVGSKLFSVAECIEEFGEEFEFLGGSPSMFTDYSWYKDIDFDFKSAILEQFNKRRHVLMYYKLGESLRSIELNRNLEKKVSEFQSLLELYENDQNNADLDEMIDLLRVISKMTIDIDSRISDAIEEGISLLSDHDINETKIANADKLSSAFGKAQQYVSLTKKFTD